ncbi:hypothetical protein GPL15_03580 [Clostridium sp. MCC353]|uniref:hypothetical protein n=1 Tax=Clostridium sp. MCC353 TaxID=2592646 RepID=UPI001C01F86F|nr:hypothetical protein [Clostridium sp. MCC353]MBT9775591.1 hypothetical protein [Clostridium sp. MCC353]
MRKAAAVFFIILFLCTGMRLYETGSLKLHEAAEQKFEISSSYVRSSGGYKDTRIHVVLIEESEDRERLFHEIRDFHDKMNGKPDRLAIYLYESREKLADGEYLEMTVFTGDE